MKLRSDFVSNSSSSSFVVMGAWIPVPEDGQNRYPYEYVNSLKLDDGVKWADDSDEEIAIGLPLEKMNDDETLKQFKERVAAILNKIPGKTFKASDISIISGVLEDGEFCAD